MKPKAQAELETAILKGRGHLSILFPTATKKEKPANHLLNGAVILFDFCSRKKEVPPQDEWPDEVADGLKRALIECDGDFFRALANAADSMTRIRTSHADHVSTMIFFAADRLKKTGEKPTKLELIKGTAKLMEKIGKTAMPTDTPQLWSPVISAAGFKRYPTARSKGTAKNHGEGSTSPRKRK